MKRKKCKRKKKFEFYFDDGDDLKALEEQLYRLIRNMDTKSERLVVIAMTEEMSFQQKADK